MNRLYRITKIALAGKYGYLKRFHKWMRGQLIRDLQAMIPTFYDEMVRKYGSN